MDIKTGQNIFSLSGKQIIVCAVVGVFVCLFVFVFFIDTRNPFGAETLKRYSGTHTLLGSKIVDKELGGIIGSRKVPALFIYLLRDRTDPNKLRVVVAQSLGYSVGEVKIEGSALNAPISFVGEGPFWGTLIKPGDRTAGEGVYERDIVALNTSGSEVQVTVNYFWVSRKDTGMYEFETLSDTTEAIFPITNP